MHRDPVWLESQYNNRARIADHAQLFEHWAYASSLARAQSVCDLDIAYGDGPAQTLDVFPSARANAPVLVFIHGGYWRSLDKRDQSFIALDFTAAGAMVVVPNYALCPSVSIETIASHMAQALVWTYRHSAQYGGNPGHIVVVGNSAGGQLAAMLLSCRWREVSPNLPPQQVRAALSISGIFDMEPLRHTPFLQVDLRLTPASARRLSPMRFPAPRGKLFAVVGADEIEEFRRQNALIQRVWGTRAVPMCKTVPSTNHLTIMGKLARPRTRLHGLALQIVGLASAAA